MPEHRTKTHTIPSFAGTIGGGLITLPTALAMHFLGSDQHPSFLPNFTLHVLFVTTAGVIIICCLQEKVLCSQW